MPLGLAVAKLQSLLSPDTSSSPAALLLLALLPRATPAGLAARLLAAPLLCTTPDGPASSGLLFFAKTNVCPPEPLLFPPPSSLTGMPLAVLPKEDTMEPEAAKDMAGELSRRRRSPLPDGPAVARLSASGLLPAAGGPFDFGVEVVFPFFIMLSSVSP